MSAWEWFFCCCCDGSRNRRMVWDEAQKKLRAETDLVEMIQVLRMVKFMRELNDDKGKFNDLIRYDRQYRTKVPAEAAFELKSNPAILREEATAKELSSENALQDVLMTNIAGEPYSAKQMEEIRASVRDAKGQLN